MKISKKLRLYVAMGLVSLLAVACDRNDVIADVASGEMIRVDISGVGIQESGSEEAIRAAALSPLIGRREIAMASLPIGNGMLLDMSLEPDEVFELRATKVLENGKRFRVIALRNSNGQYVSHADYVMTATGGVSQTAGELHVPVGNVSYDYICISYNSTTALPAASFTVGVVPANLAVPNTADTDLLYAKVTKTITSTANATLSFTLKHKLSRVTLVVDGSYNNWTITGIVANRIRLAPFYASATMNLQTGSMVKGTAATNQYFTWSTISAALTQTSATRTVFTNGETISLVVPASTITINGTSRPSSAQTLSFSTASTLTPGYNYTLRLRIRTPKWAGSNIYWDGNASSGKLTFDTYGVTTHQGYQGVYFKWGSFVGISPALTDNERPFKSNTPVYVPNGASAWVPSTYASWADIPYWDSSYGDVITDVYTSTFRGDICKKLNPDYRMPMVSEFGNSSLTTWDSRTDGWVKGGTTSATNGNAFGTTDLITLIYAKNTTMNNVIFPSNGSRNSNLNSMVGSVGTDGGYWSSSADGATNAFFMNFAANGILFSNTVTRSYGFSVRCVMK
jgi:hypothetical protein